MYLPDSEIGGGKVLRTFTRGGERLQAGHMLTRDEMLSIPTANRRALVDSNYISLYPLAAGEGHITQVSKNGFIVIKGVKVTPEPVSREEAERIVAAMLN